MITPQRYEEYLRNHSWSGRKPRFPVYFQPTVTMSHANTLTQDRGTPLRDSQRGGGWQRRTKIRWPVLYMGKEYDKVGKKWVNCKVCKGKGK